MRPETGTGWIRRKLIEKGRDWCMANQSAFAEATGNQWTPESYSRQVRREARNLREKLDVGFKRDVPEEEGQLRSSDVATPEDASDYHDIDEATFEILGGSATTWGSHTNPNRRVKIDFKRRKDVDITPEQAAERFLALVKDYAPPTVQTVPPANNGRTLEVSLPDSHIGKRIWEEATAGESYSVEAAREIYLDAVAHLTAGFDCFDSVILPLGNDFFNVDGLPRTTTKGTPQPDTEHPLKAFDIGFLTAIEAIYYLANFGPVHVPMVPGNHDRQMTYLLGVALRAWFRDMDTVTIDNEPTLHKAYGAGSWGVVWHHGDKLKPEQLAMLFADAYPDLWARTQHREVHQGHLHHSRNGEFRATDESNGVRVRLLPSLVPADEWHDKYRFRALREGTALEWDETDGLVGQRFYHPRIQRGEHSSHNR